AHARVVVVEHACQGLVHRHAAAQAERDDRRLPHRRRGAAQKTLQRAFAVATGDDLLKLLEARAKAPTPFPRRLLFASLRQLLEILEQERHAHGCTSWMKSTEMNVWRARDGGKKKRQESGVRGQGSGVRGQGSGVRGQGSAVTPSDS